MTLTICLKKNKELNNIISHPQRDITVQILLWIDRIRCLFDVTDFIPNMKTYATDFEDY